jgi:hypothetical protein
MRTALLILAFASTTLLAGACGDNQTHPDAHGGYDAGGATPLSCVPNLDGTITADEVKAVTGVAIKYLVSPNGKTRTVDVSGVTNSAGNLEWDMGTDYADDAIVPIAAAPLEGKWYAASFPGGSFATAFDAGDTVEAVYSQDESALYLHGLASTVQSPKTLLVYQQPVAIYRFPLVPGASWISTGTVVNGTLRDQPYAGQDTYESTDDATGELVLPDVTFTQVHRIRTKATVAPAAGETVVTKQVSFFFECFGEVARITSEPNEPADDFTTAAEVRRFGL